MTNWEKQAYLEQFLKLNSAIDQKLSEVYRIKAMCEKCTSVITDMPHGGANTREDMYVKFVELSDEANKLIDQYVDTKRRIEAAINTVRNVDHRTALKYRYINGETLNGVGELMHKSEKTIKRWIDKALEKMKI